jgi:hypothetical protein
MNETQMSREDREDPSRARDALETGRGAASSTIASRDRHK